MLNPTQEAIARYYDEERPQYDSLGNPKHRNHSSMILRPEYWRGQQSGSYESRHMRPMCEKISASKPDSSFAISVSLLSLTLLSRSAELSQDTQGLSFIRELRLRDLPWH